MIGQIDFKGNNIQIQPSVSKIKSAICFAVSIPYGIVTIAAGIALAIFALIATLFQEKFIHKKYAKNMLAAEANIFPQLSYYHFIKTISSNAFRKVDSSNLLKFQRSAPSSLIADKLSFRAHRLVLAHRDSNNSIVRQVISRIECLVYALLLTSGRLFEGALGASAMVVSTLFLGRFHSINNFALRNIKVSMIIHDLYICSLGCINPKYMKELIVM
ncbi:MAG: hypothetical protein QRY74_06400 [Chlamydia sp.]